MCQKGVDTRSLCLENDAEHAEMQPEVCGTDPIFLFLTSAEQGYQPIEQAQHPAHARSHRMC